METISDFIEDELFNDDEESNIDSKKEVAHENEEYVVTGESLTQ